MLRRLFLTLLLATAAFAADTFSGVARIVAIGDVHGDFDQFVTVLRSAGVINNKNGWTGGKTHLVQTGDVPDRGPDSRKVFDLLMNLEKQARRAGGQVHALIGNHDAMNVYGDLRYVTDAEYAAFRDSDSEARLEAFRKQEPETKVPLGYIEHRIAFQPGGKYGKWIAGHNAVVKINDTLFLHGGIGPKYAAMQLKQINETIQAELEDITKVQGGVAADPEGPLWYRGLAQGDETELTPHLDAVFKNFGVTSIVIGHTVTSSGTVTPRFGGRVLMIDAGMSKVYGSHQAVLVIEAGEVSAIEKGTKRKVR